MQKVMKKQRRTNLVKPQTIHYLRDLISASVATGKTVAVLV